MEDEEEFMLIRLGYDIQFETTAEVPVVTLLERAPVTGERLGRAGRDAHRAGDRRGAFR
jgi:hypothetical protein